MVYAHQGGKKRGSSCGIVRITICALTLAPVAVIVTTMYHAPGTLSSSSTTTSSSGSSGPGLKPPPPPAGAAERLLRAPVAAIPGTAAAGGQSPPNVAAPQAADPAAAAAADTHEVKTWNPLGSLGGAVSAKDPPKHPGDAFGRAAGAFYDASLNASARWEAKREFIASEPVSGDWLQDCPATPPAGYPQEYPIMDIIQNWSPDKPLPVPPRHYHALCRFDYEKPGDLEKAVAYREAEVPFIVYNNPAAQKVVRNWAKDHYLENLLGQERYRTEVSHNNHFMYFSGGSSKGKAGKKNAWRAPTSVEKMSFKKFKDAALDCEARNCTTEEQHFYFRVTAPQQNHFMFKELPFFMPKPSIFIKDPRGQRGIHCRFGMSAVIAENHYDGSRNVIGLFGGRRRYVLSHPKNCDAMYLLPMGHPSGRHSGDACNFDPACTDSPNSVDWSNPDLARWPKFKNLLANEVIMAPGDFLYLPTHWFHYIISLGLNYQCNTRSGRGNEYSKTVRKCGE
jgi:hypothetical protein